MGKLARLAAAERAAYAELNLLRANGFVVVNESDAYEQLFAELQSYRCRINYRLERVRAFRSKPAQEFKEAS